MSKRQTVKATRFDSLDPLPVVDIILAVAVDVEHKEMLQHLLPLDEHSAVLKVPHRGQTYFLGRCGLYNVALVKSEMGSTGPSGAQEVVGHTIRTWNAHAVIAVGIAFGKSDGKKRSEQRLGDVLVSRMLIPYEHERISETTSMSRDAHPEVGQTLLNRFSNSTWTWKAKDRTKRRPLLGPILSGAKLVDQVKFKKTLFAKHPTALGGEMEGVGVWGAASANKVEWIVVKAICDWGFDKSKKPQPLAAKNACNLVAAVLSEPGLASSDFHRDRHSRTSADTAKRMDTAARSMTLSHVSNQIRACHDEAERRTSQLGELVMRATRSRSKPSRKTLEEIELAKAALDANNERYLNAYNDAATRYFADDIDASAFRVGHATEVCELFDVQSEFQRLLQERPEAYESLYRAYGEFSSKQAAGSASSKPLSEPTKPHPRSFISTSPGQDRYTTECWARQLVGAPEASERLVVLAPPGAPYQGVGLNKTRLADVLFELDARNALAFPQFRGKQERLEKGVRRRDEGNVFAIGLDGSIAVRRRLRYDRSGAGRVVARGDVGLFSSIEQILACIRLARSLCECAQSPLVPWWFLHELHG